MDWKDSRFTVGKILIMQKAYSVYREKIRELSIIKRYNDFFSIDILDQLSLFENNGVGYIYLLIKKNGGSLIETADFHYAFLIDVLILAADLLDGAVDGDLFLFSKKNQENLSLLVAELLTWVLPNFSLYPTFFNSLDCLQEALIGEHNDVNYSLENNDISETFYFEKIIPKSAALFKFAAFSADYTNKDFWSDFFDKYCTYLQISNDISAIKNSTKTDIVEKKVTYPLIKAKEFGLIDFDNYKDEEIKAVLQKNGIIEYCLMMQLTYREQSINLLKQNDKAEFIEYLGLRNK